MPKNQSTIAKRARDRARQGGVKYTAALRIEEAITQRMARTGKTYTQAEEVELAIRERMDETGETYVEAEAEVTDPGNQILCQECGWLVKWICPECSGCGCNTDCTGWRHTEIQMLYGPRDPDAHLCSECGADTSSYYGCNCD